MVNIRLPDGSQRPFPGPVTVAEIAQSIGPGLARAALAGRIDGKLVDTSHSVERDAEVAIVTDKERTGSRSSGTRPLTCSPTRSKSSSPTRR